MHISLKRKSRDLFSQSKIDTHTYDLHLIKNISIQHGQTDLFTNWKETSIFFKFFFISLMLINYKKERHKYWIISLIWDLTMFLYVVCSVQCIFLIIYIKKTFVRYYFCAVRYVLCHGTGVSFESNGPQGRQKPKLTRSEFKGILMKFLNFEMTLHSYALLAKKLRTLKFRTFSDTLISFRTNVGHPSEILLK